MQVPNVIIETQATPEIEVTGVQVVLQPKVIAAGPPGQNGMVYSQIVKMNNNALAFAVAFGGN